MCSFALFSASSVTSGCDYDRYDGKSQFHFQCFPLGVFSGFHFCDYDGYEEKSEAVLCKIILRRNNDNACNMLSHSTSSTDLENSINGFRFIS